MLLVITGGCGSGKSWMAGEIQKEIKKEESAALLDCVAGILGEKLKEEQTEAVVEEILMDIHKLHEQTENLIVVTNEVFSDVPKKGSEQRFANYLGKINRELAEAADYFVEMVYGIPIWRKQK